jgi:glycosyltransferase involved in cell wall biosynthesis
MIQYANNGVSVVFGSYNRSEFIKLTVDSIRIELNDFDYPYEIIVIDGGSSDGTLNWLIEQKDILTIIQHNRGSWNGQPIKRRSWGYFMNLGFKCAKGKYICMLSDDCLVVPGAIKNGYALFEEKMNKEEKVGAIAFYFRNYPVDDFYYVGLTFGKIFVNHGMFYKKGLEEVGYIDEDSYLFIMLMGIYA